MTEHVEGQEPNEDGQEPTQDVGPVEKDGQEPTKERFDAEYVRKLRAEAAEYRKRLRDLEQAVKKHEEAKLSETERLQRRLAELEAERATWQREVQERVLRYETMLAAGRLGVVDPEAAYRLLDLSLLEYDDDGRPTNLEAALRALLKDKPYLVGQPHGPSGSPTNPGRPRTSLTLEDVKRMSPDEINRRWDEVQRVLSSG